MTFSTGPNDASPSRRRAIKVLAGAAGVGALAGIVRAMAPAPRAFHWNGRILDAVAEIELWHGDESVATNAFRKIETELARYRRVFSLFDANSEISRLNRDGFLEGPSADLRDLVAVGRRLGDQSLGAFDITVQPIWRVYEAHFWSKSGIAPDIAARALEIARALVDYREIDMSARRIAFTRQGMAMTLNGIAQGYITDAIADLLRNDGFETAFVDLGEMRGLGDHPQGRPWRVDLKDPRQPGLTNRTVELSDASLAVSGGYGTMFEPTGRFHHLFDPGSGASAREFLDVAVIGPRATLADGLSTAIYVAGEARGKTLLAAYPAYSAMFTRADQSAGRIAAL